MKKTTKVIGILAAVALSASVIIGCNNTKQAQDPMAEEPVVEETTVPTDETLPTVEQTLPTEDGTTEQPVEEIAPLN